MNLLEIKDLQVAYGGIQAVKGIDLHIAEGELVTLIGANGAGKTTTLKSIVGMVQKASGSIEYNGLDTSKEQVHHFVRKGLVMVPEGRGIFPKLTVLENLHMGAFYRNDKAQIQSEVEHIYSLFPRLQERSKQLAGTLSGGEQQMLAMGRALMSKPKLILLDEPSMGLAPLFIKEVFKLIQEIQKQGTTVLLIEQNAKMALSIASRGYVLETGRIVLEGTGGELLHSDAVKKAYLGG